MQRVGEFEKVSYEQFCDAMWELYNTSKENAAPVLDDDEFIDDTRYMYDVQLYLPSRATSGSAGYDFRAPFAFTLTPGASIKIPTGIRVKIDEGWWLGCLPRSSHGFKYRVQLDNTLGVVDGDYYYSDNEGHIFIKITNDGREGKTLRVEAGDSFTQAIFIPYGITYSDNATGVRNGGMGSTGA